MRFPSFQKNKEKTPKRLEPTPELIQSLFDRADINIVFAENYPGIPSDFFLSEDEKTILQRVNHIFIDERDVPIKYSYENKSKTETPVYGAISLPDTDVERVILNVFRRLKIAAVYERTVHDDISAAA